jgi:hypothetical protein
MSHPKNALVPTLGVGTRARRVGRGFPDRNTSGTSASPPRPIRSSGLTQRFTDSWSCPKDTDFQQRALVYGHPPKVIWVRLGNSSTSAVAALLRSRLAEIQAFEADQIASFLAVS